LGGVAKVKATTNYLLIEWKGMRQWRAVIPLAMMLLHLGKAAAYARDWSMDGIEVKVCNG
jgi:hypothetical protein